MPPRDWRLRLGDMLDAAEAAQRFVHAISYEQFAAPENDLVRAAVERKLEIIGEAASALPEEVLSRSRDVEWSDVRGFRIILAHRYFDLNHRRLWDTVHVELPPLVIALRRLIEPL